MRALDAIAPNRIGSGEDDLCATTDGGVETLGVHGPAYFRAGLNPMQAKYFTLDEAKAALPQVKALMARVQEARSEIIRLRPDVCRP